MKRFLAMLMAAGLLLGGFGVARADKPENPGEKGHCTAFFNGQKKGHDKQAEDGGSYPGPFQDLQDRAPDGSDENDTGGDLADLFDYCMNTYGIGGNADENGRFTTCYVDDDEDADTHNCDDEPAPAT